MLWDKPSMENGREKEFGSLGTGATRVLTKKQILWNAVMKADAAAETAAATSAPTPAAVPRAATRAAATAPARGSAAAP